MPSRSKMPSIKRFGPLKGKYYIINKRLKQRQLTSNRSKSVMTMPITATTATQTSISGPVNPILVRPPPVVSTLSTTRPRSRIRRSGRLRKSHHPPSRYVQSPPRPAPRAPSKSLSRLHRNASLATRLTPYSNSGADIFISESEKFTSVKNLRNIKELLKMLKNLDSLQPGDEARFQCPKCSYQMYQFPLVRAHFMVHHLGKRFICPLRPDCDQLFKAKSNAVVHAAKIHNCQRRVDDDLLFFESDTE